MAYLTCGIVAASFACLGYVRGFRAIRSGAWKPSLTTWIVVFLAWKLGVLSWSLFDSLCTIFAGVSILVWYISGSPLLALTGSLVAHLFGFIPTLKSSQFTPEKEDLLT